ncbi:MAG: hypothetical protein D6722_09920 [Bacteroidetes bacterium]|nr:MAG: hypothetical protein D6722_09920 [Bacteroidota bacterium]
MKKILQTLSLLSLLVLGMGLQQAVAQRISLTGNLAQFQIADASQGSSNIAYNGVTDMTANLRLYSKNKWALRVGAGVENLRYRVSSTGLQTSYNAQRSDLKGLIGLEKHFVIANFLDVYPGMYVPVVITGIDEMLEANLDNIENGGVRSGLGVILGANIKLFKILRVGVEFDANYDNFKQAVWEGIDAQSVVPIRGMNYQTNFTLGIAL